MSIIIRLQNLPLSAKSGDIRRFFGGLRIPNGGVHIVGGDKGDAFIAFTSDEDARLAMRKDGGKIIDTRVKLFLSSRMEMQHEIGRITKEFPDASRQRSPTGRQRDGSPPADRSIEYDRSYRSGSSSRGRRGYSPRSRRSRSPRMRSRSPRRRSRSPRRKSRSPRRRSRSPKLISGSRRSRSPIQRLAISPARRSSPHLRSISLYRKDLGDSQYGKERDPNAYRDGKLLKLEEYFGIEHLSKDHANWKGNDFSRREEQALLEQKIAEALTVGLGSIEKFKDMYHQSGKVAESGMNMQVGRGGGQFANLDPNLMPYKPEYNNSGLREVTIQDNNRLFMSNILSAANINVNPPRNFTPGVQSLPHPMSLPPPSVMPPMVGLPPPIPMGNLPPSLPMPPIAPPVSMVSMAPASIPSIPPSVPNSVLNQNIPRLGFFVTISGLNPFWDSNDVQNMLKGIFVPLKNIKWEMDDRGSKTGTAFIKLCNREDFMQLLSYATYSFNNRLITVSECPDCVFQRYFMPEMPSEGSLNSPRGNFYYKMKGLPYEVTYEDVLNFFEGLEVTDLYVIYSKDTNGFRIQGKATGIAFIAFGNSCDHQKAMLRHGTQFGNTNRIIHLLNSSKKKMLEMKQKNNDLLSQSKVFTYANVTENRALQDAGSSQRRPLCALLTGLPQNITNLKIIKFFKTTGSNPGAIHITLNDKQQPNGRAFIEFNTLQDFDAARQCHGNRIGDKIICVRQILYDEMEKVLNTQKVRSSQKSKQNAHKKVPYLQKPPDMFRNQPDQIPNMVFPEEDKFRMPNNLEYSSTRPNFQVFEYGNHSSVPMSVPDPTPEPNMLFDREAALGSSADFKDLHRYLEDAHRHQTIHSLAQEQPFENRVRDHGTFDIMQDGNPGKRSGNYNKEDLRKKMALEEAARNPVKFEVKIKPAISKSTKVEDAFDSTSKVDPKKKLSKLSPERPPAPSKPPNSTKNDKNKSIEGTPKPKAKSPERSSRKKDGRNSPEALSSKSELRDGKNYRPRNKSRNRNNDRRISEDRHRSQQRLNARIRRTSRSPLRQGSYSKVDPYGYDGTHADFREAVVQICNVDPVLGSPEVKNFLRGYEIDVDKIIRRFTDIGEPTGDVRVTFRSFKDAERAIRTLNGSFINGVPVDMFLVN